jgi:hypothetical protein
LLESKMLDDESRGEWLRKQGLHSEQLPLWEQELAGMVQDKQSALKSENAREEVAGKGSEGQGTGTGGEGKGAGRCSGAAQKKHQNLFREDDES